MAWSRWVGSTCVLRTSNGLVGLQWEGSALSMRMIIDEYMRMKEKHGAK